MLEPQLKACSKTLKNPENGKVVSCSKSTSQKQSRKGDNPVQFSPATDESSDRQCSTTRECKNTVCRAVLSINDAFCRRCSCCICHRYDDNKDLSLWLVCGSESQPGNSCGLSCHVECAFDKEKLGVVKLGQYMQLDGSYCCASCGKVSGILGCWKRQLCIARDARGVDALCYRLFLSYRLLDGTSRFKELHEIAAEAKTKLEAELGPINGDTIKTNRGIVSRLTIASDVQKLCTNAIDKAEEWLAKVPCISPNCTVSSLPTACRFVFEEVTSSSLIIVLIDIPTPLIDSIKGYKLWYCKSTEDNFSKHPPFIFSRDKLRISVKFLQPSTEYAFRIITYTETGDLGQSEARCFTKNVENPSPVKSDLAGSSSEPCCRVENGEARIDDPSPPPVVRDLDLNVVSVPDLNEDLTPPLESSKDEVTEPSDDSQTWGPMQPKRAFSAVEEAYDCDSALMNGSSQFCDPSGPGSLDGDFEYCVKVIRWLECQGYIKQEFRLKLLTWFSLKSTDQQRRVVTTFIQTLMDDPKSLAGQLVDSFSDIVTSKRPWSSFTCKLTTIA
ncbi:hypothetical protein vseg_000518 [Gypsophila vaccaria]